MEQPNLSAFESAPIHPSSDQAERISTLEKEVEKLEESTLMHEARVYILARSVDKVPEHQAQIEELKRKASDNRAKVGELQGLIAAARADEDRGRGESSRVGRLADKRFKPN